LPQLQENRIKRVVRDGGVAVGTVLGEFGTRGIAKLVEYADLDWVMLDVRHGGFSIDAIANILAWFKATSITVIVSPPRYLLPTIMDVGATAVQIDDVETVADARAIVDAVMYPPLGRRAVNMNSAHTDFKRPAPSEYMRDRNAEVSIVANIESRKGLDNVDKIAAVEGIDIIQPSHNDLSVDLGIPQQYDHPEYKKALRTVADASKRHGKMLKFHPGYGRSYVSLRARLPHHGDQRCDHHLSKRARG